MNQNHSSDTAVKVAALAVWIISLVLSLAFWGLLAYGVWEGIQWLQRN